MADYQWCFDCPHEAAAHIDALEARLAAAEGLLRDIYSYAEDQSMETLMDMIDAARATDSADGGEK